MMSTDSIGKPRHPVRRAPKLELRDPIEVLRSEKFITAYDIQRALSTPARPWTRRMATEWMADSGCAFQLRTRRKKRKPGQRGGPWYISPLKMRKRYPDIMDLIEQDRLDREDDDEDELDVA